MICEMWGRLIKDYGFDGARRARRARSAAGERRLRGTELRSVGINVETGRIARRRLVVITITDRDLEAASEALDATFNEKTSSCLEPRARKDDPD
jgi:hypothetical protein